MRRDRTGEVVEENELALELPGARQRCRNGWLGEDEQG